MQKFSKRTHDFETDSIAIPGPPPPFPPQLKLLLQVLIRLV